MKFYIVVWPNRNSNYQRDIALTRGKYYTPFISLKIKRFL